MIDRLSRFTCNGEKAFNVSVLTGVGTYLNLFSGLADAYEIQTFRVKYFPVGAAAGKLELFAGSYNSTSN